MSTPQNDIIPNGEEIVERFGGIRPMAAKLDIAVTTVQGWKKRDAIPIARRDEILSAAAAHGVNLKGLVAGAPSARPTAPAPQNLKNAPASFIEEDPALSAPSPRAHTPSQASAAPTTPRPAPQAPMAEPTKRPQQHRAHQEEFIDLKGVRKVARRTSLLTTSALLLIVGGAGYLLFAGNNTATQDSAQISALSKRVIAVEGQGNVLEQLRSQVQDVTDIFGVNQDDLRKMAQGIRNGHVSPILNRLASLEQVLSQTSGDFGDLQHMIRRMESELSTPQDETRWDAGIAELRNIVSGLQGNVDGLGEALANVSTQNTALAQNLAGVSGSDMEAAAMLLALTQVRAMIDRQAPFEDDLVLLRRVAGDDPVLIASIERMAPYAQNGVLSAAGLKRELAGLSNDIMTAKLRGENLSFKERLMARVNDMFSLKKEGATVAGGLAVGAERDLIAHASAQLDAGDIAGATATLQRLDGAAAQAASPWTRQANATLAVEALDTQLVKTLVAKLQRATRGGQAPINLAPQSRFNATPPLGTAPAVAPQAVPQIAPEAAPQLNPQVSPQVAPATNPAALPDSPFGYEGQNIIPDTTTPQD